MNTHIHTAVENCIGRERGKDMTMMVDNLRNAIQCNIKDINSLNAYGYTAIHLAARNGLYDCFVVLLDFGADPCITYMGSNQDIPRSVENIGSSIIHLTMLHSGFTHNQTCLILEILIDRGIDVNIQDDKGDTPLHHAARQNCDYCIKFFLENGAKWEVKNSLGQIPFDLMGLHGETEGRILLLEAQYPKFQFRAHNL